MERERDIASTIGPGRVALEDQEGIRRKINEKRHRVEIQPLTRHHPIRLRTYRQPGIQKRDS